MDAPPASSDKIAVSWVISPELARASTNKERQLLRWSCDQWDCCNHGDQCLGEYLHFGVDRQFTAGQ